MRIQSRKIVDLVDSHEESVSDDSNGVGSNSSEKSDPFYSSKKAESSDSSAVSAKNSMSMSSSSDDEYKVVYESCTGRKRKPVVLVVSKPGEKSFTL